MAELGKLFLLIVNMSLTAGMLVPIVLIARAMLVKAPKMFSYALWGIVGFRLICPVSFSSMFSVFRFPVVKEHAVFETATVSSGGTLSTQMISVPKTFSGTVQKVGAVTGNSMGIAEVLAVIWMIGIAIFLTYETISWIKLKKQVSQAVRYRDSIFECDQIAAPFVMGILKPAIYIPFRLTEEEREYILLHEQYHIRRKDYLVKFLAVILLTIYWFQPLVWIAFWGMSRDMEMSCDEWVIRELGETVKAGYSDSLLSFATGRKIPVVSPLAFGESSVKSRIRNILQFKKSGKFVVAVAVIVCVIVAVFGITNGKEETEPASNRMQREVSEMAKKLFEAKTPYIGNASAVGKLLGVLDVGSLGNYTMELQTSEEPYVLKLNFEKEPENPNLFGIEMHEDAVMLLALIENAGEVWWTYPAEEGLFTWYCDLETANRSLTTDNIKEFARSEKDVQKMLDKKIIHHKLENERAVIRKKDGYHTPGGIYQYRLVLTGRHPNAVGDSTWVVYTNEEDLTFGAVSENIFSSQTPENRMHKMYVSYVESPFLVESRTE